MKLWQTAESDASEQIEAFLAGDDVKLDAQLLKYELSGSIAHAMGLQKIGILSSEELNQLRDQLSALVGQDIELSPSDEDIHTFVENYLVSNLGELGEKIHTGRSRNDQVLVNLRLYAKDQLQQISFEAIRLSQELLSLAKEHQLVHMPGTTHTRFAMPSSIGLWAASFVDGLLESLQLINSVYALINRSPLGSSAGYGVPLPLEREYVAALLGFESVQINPLSTVSGRAKLDFALVNSLQMVMSDLDRLSADLIWGSSEQFGFFEIPVEYCTGSSIMPNKSNPDVLELIRGRAAKLAGNAVQASFTMHGAISGYHRDHQELKGALMNSCDIVLSSLQMMRGIISGLGINEAALAEAHSAEIYAVDEMVKCVQSGETLRSAYRSVKNSLENLESIDAVEALKARTHIGGAGNLGLENYGTSIEKQSEKWNERSEQFRSSLAVLFEESA